MPRLELNIGGAAKIARTHERSTITGTTVVFSYTVQNGDDDADGISIGANKLTTQSNRGITDNYSGCCPGGNNADLTHSAVADNSGHNVATSAPAKSTDATLSALTLEQHKHWHIRVGNHLLHRSGPQQRIAERRSARP